MSLFDPDTLTGPAEDFNNPQDPDPTLQYTRSIVPNPAYDAKDDEAPHVFNTPPAAIEPEQPIPQSYAVVPPPAATSTAPYGIEKVIRLIRSLPPGSDQDLAITLIIRTLDSSGVNVRSLLTDATEKEQQATSAIQKLEKEIQLLQTQINERHQQIDSLASLLNEFTLIRKKIEHLTTAQ